MLSVKNIYKKKKDSNSKIIKHKIKFIIRDFK